MAGQRAVMKVEQKAAWKVVHSAASWAALKAAPKVAHSADLRAGHSVATKAARTADR